MNYLTAGTRRRTIIAERSSETRKDLGGFLVPVAHRSLPSSQLAGSRTWAKFNRWRRDANSARNEENEIIQRVEQKREERGNILILSCSRVPDRIISVLEQVVRATSHGLPNDSNESSRRGIYTRAYAGQTRNHGSRRDRSPQFCRVDILMPCELVP